MPLSDNQRAYVRSEVGSATPPSDNDLNDRFDALDSVSGVVLEILRTRRADLLATGLTSGFAIPGFYSETASATDILKALDAQIARIEANACAIDDGDYTPAIMGVARLVRSGYNRRPAATYPTTLA